MGLSSYSELWGKWDSLPCLIVTVFTIWTKWATTLNVCVIYPNCMIYVPVQFLHCAQFFQELYWVLTLCVSLCPTLGHIRDKYFQDKESYFQRKNILLFQKDISSKKIERSQKKAVLFKKTVFPNIKIWPDLFILVALKKYFKIEKGVFSRIL